MEIAVLALAGSGTAGAHAATIRPALWGMTVGLVTVASVVGLLLPASTRARQRRWPRGS